MVIRLKKHEFFQREDSNLYGEVSIPFALAALGTVIKVPTLEEPEDLKIPAGTQPGHVFKLKGRGVKNLHGYGKGDIYIKLVVRTPEHLNKEEKDLLKKFSAMRGEDAEDGKDKTLKDKVKNIFH